MSEKFRDRNRIKSNRRSGWDYRGPGKYFVTTVTHERQCWFGQIKNQEMQLSEIGKIVKQEWVKTPNIRRDMNLQLGEFQVMPNHFHGIISIGQNQFNYLNSFNKFGPQSKNLGSIISGFKISITIAARKINQDFAWQSRYHDHIIKDEAEYLRIAGYIKNNPRTWNEDRFWL